MDSLHSPVFHINTSILAHGPCENPQSGEEYVKNVIFERKECLETVTVNYDSKYLNSKQNVFAEELPITTSAPDFLLPTKEWQCYQEADFSDLRCQVSRLYKTKNVWRHSIKLPSIGREDSETLWRNFFRKNQPTLALVFTMSQSVLEFTLDVLIDNLNELSPGKGIPSECGKWLYAILACLKLPLVPNACSSLRELARKCSEIRARLSMEDRAIMKKTAPLNLFICLVARYFRQADLADRPNK